MKVFIAGTMQGLSAGYEVVDQTYRARIRSKIIEHFPHSDITCPYEIMVRRFKTQIEQLIQLHRSFSFHSVLEPNRLGPPLADVIDAFRELVEAARQSDLVVAYLPGTGLSMGTAMEMWAGFSGGAKVIAITEKTQNLAILSTSTGIVSSIDKLDEVFTSAWFQRHP